MVKSSSLRWFEASGASPDFNSAIKSAFLTRLPSGSVPKKSSARVRSVAATSIVTHDCVQSRSNCRICSRSASDPGSDARVTEVRRLSAARNMQIRKIFMGILHRTCTLLCVLIRHHFSTLHYELHPLKRRDIFQRVAFDRDQVGPLARLERADLARPTEQVSPVDGCCLNRLQRAHPEPHIDRELVRVQAMRINRRIGSEGNLYSRRERLLEGVLSDCRNRLHLSDNVVRSISLAEVLAVPIH